MNERKFSVAVVGATGIVGRELTNILDQRLFPLAELHLYASARSAGDVVICGPLTSRVGLLGQARFTGTEIVFFAAGEQISAEWVPRATEAGAVVIDTSLLFAADADVPLIVPEVNAAEMGSYVERNVIVSPDAIAIAAAIALKPLHDAAGITHLVATTLEPVSGAGKVGIDEMQTQTVELMNGRDADISVFPQRIAFNLIPQIGEFLSGGRTSQEEQTCVALRRLLSDDLVIGLTRVRVPMFFGTAISASIETLQPLSAEEAREILRGAPGVLLYDQEDAPQYSSPADAIGEDATCVGRIRAHEATNRLDLWITIDNMRKGSALNAVQIAEILTRDYL